MLRCIHGVGGHVNVHVKCIRCRCYVAYMGWGGACYRSCEVHTVSMLRCMVGVGMLTFMWSAYGVDATLHGGGGHVNVHVKCMRCRCYVAYMGWGGPGGHVNVHVKCIRCRCYVAWWGGMLTFMWNAYGVDATLHTWGGGGMLTFMWSAYSVDATLHTRGGGGMLTFMWSAYSVDATLHTWGGGGHVNVHVKCIQCRCYVAYMGWGAC